MPIRWAWVYRSRLLQHPRLRRFGRCRLSETLAQKGGPKMKVKIKLGKCSFELQLSKVVALTLLTLMC